MPKKKQVSASQRNSMTKPRKVKSESRGNLWSTKDVQEKLGMSEKSARNFLASIPIAEVKDRFNWYDPKAVTEAAKQKTKKNEATEGSREWYEIEKLKRQIDKLDFDLEVVKGNYLKIEEVRHGYLGQSLAMRKQWLEMVEKLPPLLSGLPPADMQGKLKHYVNEAFEKLRGHTFAGNNKGMFKHI
jgi:hypothetical protein